MYQPPSQWGDPGQRIEVSDLGDDDPLVDDPKKSRPRLKTTKQSDGLGGALRVLALTFGFLVIAMIVGLFDFLSNH